MKQIDEAASIIHTHGQRHVRICCPLLLSFNFLVTNPRTGIGPVPKVPNSEDDSPQPGT